MLLSTSPTHSQQLLPNQKQQLEKGANQFHFLDTAADFFFDFLCTTRALLDGRTEPLAADVDDGHRMGRGLSLSRPCASNNNNLQNFIFKKH